MKLEKVLTYQKGRSPQKDFVSDNLILYLTPEYLRGNGLPNFISDFPSKVSVEDGDLLLLWDGSNAGEFFKGRNGYLSSTMVKFKFNEEEYQREFLFYQLKAFEGYLKAQTNGSGIPHVDRELLLGIEVEKFEKPEQKRIAQILSKTDAAIAQTEALIAKYQRIKTGLMQDLLTRGIDEHGNIRSKTSHRFVVKNGIEVPEEWDVVELSQILAKPLTYGIVQPGSHEPEGIYIIRSQDYSKGWNPLDTIMKVSKEIDRPYERSRVFEGDLLITVVGANVGRMAVVPKELSGANISRSVARLAINTNENVSLFYFHYLRNRINKILFENTVGGAQPVLNLKELNNILITKPDPSEQRKISERIESIEAHIENQFSNLNKLQSLKTGLMHDLLSGRVRVKMSEPLITAD